LICSCIGYLGEQYLKKEQAKKEFETTHVEITDTAQSSVVGVSQSVVPTASNTGAVSQSIVPVNNSGTVTSMNQNQ
jgi:hypothetical protein